MLPVEFIDIMQQQLGAQAPELFHALEQEPVTSIRLNDKIDELSFDADIDEVPWHYDGYYLSERPQFMLDPLMHAGCYYVQEASSMLIQRALEQYVSEDSVVLDLCAAPGGKATLISQYLGAQGLLVANEVVRQRVFILSENIQKWGNGNTVVTHNAPALFGEALPNTFDCVLVDAPCSGEGMFRKDEQAIAEWSPRNVRLCVDRQRTILHDMWDALKPGGILIYSTCTFNRHECEENALWIADELGADILPLGLDPSWGITESIAGYHCYPHLVRGEGFYLCVLRKRRQQHTYHRRGPRTRTLMAHPSRRLGTAATRQVHNRLPCQVQRADRLYEHAFPVHLTGLRIGGRARQTVCSAAQPVNVEGYTSGGIPAT